MLMYTYEFIWTHDDVPERGEARFYLEQGQPLVDALWVEGVPLPPAAPEWGEIAAWLETDRYHEMIGAACAQREYAREIAKWG